MNRTMQQAVDRRFTSFDAWILVAGIALAVVATPMIPQYLSHLTGKIDQQKVNCITNPKTIKGGKIAWAFKQKKHQTDSPMDADLFGTDKGIPDKPICRAGGIY